LRWLLLLLLPLRQLLPLLLLHLRRRLHLRQRRLPPNRRRRLLRRALRWRQRRRLLMLRRRLLLILWRLLLRRRLDERKPDALRLALAPVDDNPVFWWDDRAVHLHHLHLFGRPVLVPVPAQAPHSDLGLGLVCHAAGCHANFYARGGFLPC
jgi:hypothetical protein